MDKLRPSGIACDLSHCHRSGQWHKLCDQSHCQERRRHQSAIGKLRTGYACHRAHRTDSGCGRKGQRKPGPDVGRSCQHWRIANHRLSGEVFEQQRFDMDKLRPSGIACDLSHCHRSGQWHKLCDQSHCQERRRHQSAIGKLGTSDTCCNGSRQSDIRSDRQWQRSTGRYVDRPCEHWRIADHRLLGAVLEKRCCWMGNVCPSGIACDLTHPNRSDQWRKLCDQSHR